jgi:hypothetical protein
MVNNINSKINKKILCFLNFKLQDKLNYFQLFELLSLLLFIRIKNVIIFEIIKASIK